jgi:cytochrome b
MAIVVRVWDAPTRLFHWALAVCFVSLVVTAQIGGAAMEWHFRLGYTVAALLCFRLIWGFIGGHWSRFSAFLYRPNQLILYMRGQRGLISNVGHNPLGSLSVFALLGFMSLQVISGMFSDDEIAAAGPLVRFVSSQWVSNATLYHKDVGKLVLLTLVSLHLLSICFYFFKKKENLVIPMITGDKILDYPVESSKDEFSDRIKAALICLFCGLFIAGLVAWTN